MTKVIQEVPGSEVNTNKKGGATISVRRKGGWSESFKLAAKLAGWE